MVKDFNEGLFMGFESFDPSQKKYKKTSDLPVALQGKFEDVPGGFVRKEVIRYETNLRNSTEGRAERYDKPITIEGLREEDARKQDQEIEIAVNAQVKRLETSLGKSLSEDAKRQIYKQIAPSVYLTTQQRYDRHYEQGHFLNIQIDELSRKIVEMSEEQMDALSSEQKRNMLSQLAEFDRFVPGAEQSEVLDSASRKLLEGYKQGNELMRIHREAHKEVIEGFEPLQLLEFYYGFSSFSQETQLALCQKVVDLFASSYGLSEVPKVVIPPRLSGNTLEPLASFSDGKVLIHDPARVFSSFSEMASVMAHELAHAHQKEITRDSESSKAELQEDRLWFQLDEKLENVYSQEFYKDNYHSMSKEQDAYSAGEAFGATLGKQTDALIQAWDEILARNGFPSALELGNNSFIFQNAQKLIENGKVADGNELIRLLEDRYLILSNDAEPFFQGKTLEECQESIRIFSATMHKALDLFVDHAERDHSADLSRRGSGDRESGIETQEQERREYVKKCFAEGLNNPDIIAYHGCDLETIRYVIKHGVVPGATRSQTSFSQHGVPELSVFPVASKKINYEPKPGFSDDLAFSGVESYAAASAEQHMFEKALGLDYFSNSKEHPLVNVMMDDDDIIKEVRKMGKMVTLKQVREARNHAVTSKSRGVIIGISKQAFLDFGNYDTSEGGEEDEKVLVLPQGLGYRYIVGIEPMGQIEYNFFSDL